MKERQLITGPREAGWSAEDKGCVLLEYDDGYIKLTPGCVRALVQLFMGSLLDKACSISSEETQVNGLPCPPARHEPEPIECGQRKAWAEAIGLSFKDIEDNNLDVYFDFDKQALYIRDIGKNSIGPISFSTRRAKTYTSEFLAQYSSKQTAVAGCIAHYLITNKVEPTRTTTMRNESSISLAPFEIKPSSIDAIIKKFGPDVHIEPGQDEDGKINGRYL